MRYLKSLMTALVAVLLAAPAAPALAASHDAGHDGGPVLLGFKVGAGFGQIASPFGTTFVPELEVGYGFGASHSFSLNLAGQYAAPSTTGTAPKDPRLPGSGVMTYTLVQNQLILTLSAMYRFETGSAWRPYLALGPRLYLMRTDITATGGGQDYGKNAETSTQVGFYAAVGTEYALGPGALTGELQFGYASVDQYVLRKTSVGALNVVVGYRIRF
jgi:hypothetical protein